MSGQVVVACDKFKGTLTATQVAAAIERGVRSERPAAVVDSYVVADGGDGTLAAVESAGFTRNPVTVTGPTGERRHSYYAARGDVAVIELAETCGLVHAHQLGLDALAASSRGFGEAIVAAWDAGYRTLVLGIGGSASTDGGAGMLAAWGAVARDSSGAAVPDGGGALGAVEQLDLSGLHPALAESSLTIACDVNNPLLGEQGAVAIFSAQKGATVDDQYVLERGLTQWAQVCEDAWGNSARDRSGAGAAGGVGFALLLAGATMRPGIDVIMDVVGLPGAMSGASLVITGEGSLDEQTLLGKAPAGVARLAQQHGVPVVAVCGRSVLTAQQVTAAGISAVYALTDLEPVVSRCMTEAEPLLQALSAQVAQRHL